jgi:hypothetical protein
VRVLTVRALSDLRCNLPSDTSEEVHTSKRHVYDVKRSGDDWAVKERGGARSVGNFDTKDKAVDRARDVARNNPEPAQVVIHKENGRIQTEHTYKKDPNPPKG